MRAMAANEGRHPISAQRGLLGVARSTCCSMRSRPGRPAAPDPAAPAVVAARAASKGRYGSRKIKASPGRSGVTVSRRRVCRIMGESGPVGACGGKRFKVRPRGGQRGRRAERRRARLRRQGAAYPHMRRPGLRARRNLVELRLPARRVLQRGDRRPPRRAREGRPAGQVGVRDALLPHLGHRGLPHGPRQRVRRRRDRPDARGLRRREVAVGQGPPRVSAVDEPTDRIPRAGLVHREAFGTTRELRAKLSDYVHRYNNFRIHSTPG